MKWTFAVLVFSCASAFAEEVDWDKRTQTAVWSRPAEESSLFTSTMRANGGYQITLEHIWSRKFLVHVRKGASERLKLKAHSATVFVIRENLFIYALSLAQAAPDAE